MGMTVTEKILAKHSGNSSVQPGDNVWVDVDVLMTHDVCGPPSIGIFKKQFGEQAKVWDKDKLVIIPDHYIFTDDKYANRNVDLLRAFADEQSLPNYYDVGTDRYKGVCHVAMPEEGFTRPGEVLFGTDSHTCTAGAFGEFATGIGNTDAAFIMGTGKLWVKVPETMRFVFDGEIPPYIMAKDIILQIIGDIGVDGATYRTMEFAGSSVENMDMEARMTLTNMVIEAGGKNGVINPDEVTYDYVKSRTDHPFEPEHSDEDAEYHSVYEYRADEMSPMLAKPHSPDNKATVEEVQGTELTRAYIGSCTGGKFSDFVAAVEILKGKKVKLDTFIVPASTEVAQRLRTEKMNGKTYMEIFKEAGAAIGEASCAACLGGPSDTFGRLNGEEVCISSTNRNFPGRMGSKQSQVYLASPYTVAASALTGKITPAMSTLHYGQAVFEGMKAFYNEDALRVFRPDAHHERFNVSCQRMCIPATDYGTFIRGIETLLSMDSDWVPRNSGQALYIRPFIFATDNYLAVTVSDTYNFLIITSPVGAYYKEGINPVSLVTPEEYVRTVRGGVGTVKTLGNYAASLLPAQKAKNQGFTQVLWLDAVEHKYIEEVGTMNIFFKIDGTLVTPPLEGTILPGVTRDSVIQIAKDWNVPVEERRISIDEVIQRSKDGELEEVFGTGTAAVISPVGTIQHRETSISINGDEIGPFARQLYDEITGIQYGTRPDRFGWIHQVQPEHW